MGELHAKGGEGLADFVVEFLGKGSALLLLDFEEAIGEVFEFEVDEGNGFEVALAFAGEAEGVAEAEKRDEDADDDGDGEEEEEAAGGGGAVRLVLGLGDDEFLADGATDIFEETEERIAAREEDLFDHVGGRVKGGEAGFLDVAQLVKKEMKGVGHLLGAADGEAAFAKTGEGIGFDRFEFGEAGAESFAADDGLFEEEVAGVDATEKDDAAEGGDGVIAADEALVGEVLFGGAGALEAEGFGGGIDKETQDDRES